MVIDRGVQEGVAQPGTAVGVGGVSGCGGAVEFALRAALGAPASAIGDVTEFLDVDVDQVAGCGVFVAADRLGGASVQVGKSGGAAGAQDRVAGRRGQAETPADTHRPQPFGGAQVQHAAFDRPGCAVRAVVRSAGPVAHASDAFGQVSLSPPFRDPHADLESVRSPPQRPTTIDDTASEAQSASFGQGCISVGHEDLPGGCGTFDKLHLTRRSSSMSGTPCCYQRPWTEHLVPGVAAPGCTFPSHRPVSRRYRAQNPTPSRGSG